MKNHPQNRRKHLSDKGLEARKYKNHNSTHTHTRKNKWGEGANNPTALSEGATFAQNRQSTLRTLTDISAKKIYQWPKQKTRCSISVGNVNQNNKQDLLCGPMVKNLPCNAGDMVSIPGQETKILHAVDQQSPRV